MSEREQPIRQWNAVMYVRDFINTALILTQEEEKILHYICDKARDLPVLPPRFTKDAKILKKRIKKCNVCGQNLDITEFYTYFAICKKCYSKKRKQERKENKRKKQ